MAEIALGIGTSHGSLLITEPANWDGRAAADRRNKALAFRGGVYSFDELFALRQAEDDFAAQSALAVRTERHARCQSRLDSLADVLAEASPDMVVVIGDDQHEWFSEAVQPSYAVYCGDRVASLALTAEALERNARAGRLIDPTGYHPSDDRTYPVAKDLALHIIRGSMADGFDVAACMAQPETAQGLTNLGHAYAFIYRRLLRDRPVPMVPVLINTFYPPNQPAPQRCVAFGRAIGRAIRSWPGDAKVAVCASGGLSHFVIDEAFDLRLLDALKSRDEAALMREPDEMFRSGTSETKNWLVVAGILAGSDLEMNLLDYVPCYRSEAGTGNAMAFATWQ